MTPRASSAVGAAASSTPRVVLLFASDALLTSVMRAPAIAAITEVSKLVSPAIIATVDGTQACEWSKIWASATGRNVRTYGLDGSVKNLAGDVVRRWKAPASGVRKSDPKELLAAAAAAFECAVLIDKGGAVGAVAAQLSTRFDRTVAASEQLASSYGLAVFRMNLQPQRRRARKA